MKSLLIYNPASGTALEQRLVRIQRVAATLRSHGFDLAVVATTHRGSAAQQARAAIADGVAVVFVCGGDGTIHDVLQGVAGTHAILAPIPFGSANALCRELGVPLEPLKAAAAYAKTTQRDVRVGVCECASRKRFFLLMAGAGPDGALMYRMLTASRSVAGRWAYALHALRLLLRRKFAPFRVRYRMADGRWRGVNAVFAIALRAGNLGGIFPGVAREACFDAATMRLVMVSPPPLVTLPLWFLTSWLRMERWNPMLLREDVTAFECEGDGVHAQADGEWIGKLPMAVTLEERTVRLLVPLG